MINIAILDDQTDFCKNESEMISQYFQKYQLEYNIVTFSTVKDFEESLKIHCYNIVLIDYILDENDCFTILSKFGDYLAHSIIMIVTSNTTLTPVKKAFKFNIFRYLTKDEFDTEIVASLDDAIQEIQYTESFFVIDYKHKPETIYYKDLIGVYTEGHYTILQFETKYYRIRESLKSLSDLLVAHKFIKVKSNTFINPDYILRVDKKHIVMQGNWKFDLSKLGYKILKEYLCK